MRNAPVFLLKHCPKEQLHENATHSLNTCRACGNHNRRRADTVDGVTNAVAPVITGKKSAVKVEMNVDAPQQFFKVKFGE